MGSNPIYLANGMKPYCTLKYLLKGYCCDSCDGPLSRRRQHQKRKKLGKTGARKRAKVDLDKELKNI